MILCHCHSVDNHHIQLLVLTRLSEYPFNSCDRALDLSQEVMCSNPSGGRLPPLQDRTLHCQANESNLFFLVFKILYETRHVFEKHGCPGGNIVKIWQKSLSPLF